MKRESFLIYTSFYKPVSKLSDEQLGRLFRALFRYNLEEGVEVDPDIEMAFEFFKNQMDIDNSKWLKKVEKLRENAKKSRSKQMLPNATKSNPIGLVNVNENVNENVIKEEKLKEESQILFPKPEITAAPRFRKPTVQEVSSYCAERKNNVDAEAFWNFYESKGWKVGKNPMKSWKAAIVTWEKSRGITKPRVSKREDVSQTQFTIDPTREVML